MTTATFYREQAEKCLQRAREMGEAENSALRALAEDYLRLAEELEKAIG
jgi:hypothetical protein